MPQSLHQLYANIIFSRKHRQPILLEEHRISLFAYLAGILRNLECHSVNIGGVDDHIHIVCALNKKQSSMKVVEIIKKDSSKWLKTHASILNVSDYPGRSLKLNFKINYIKI